MPRVGDRIALFCSVQSWESNPPWWSIRKTEETNNGTCNCALKRIKNTVSFLLFMYLEIFKGKQKLHI